MQFQTLLLNQDDVVRAGALDMEKAVADVEDVFRLKKEGDFVLPPKTVLRWGDMDSEITRGRFNSMPAFIGGRFNAVGIKWISSFPKNVEMGMPRAIGTIILNDPRTGMPAAIMDGTIISAMRTGAVTGVAARYLAKKDSQTLGIIGAGVQSRTQIRAILVTCPGISRIRVFDLDKKRAQNFSREINDETSIPVEVVDSARDCAIGADILVTATTATEPIVYQDWLEEGSFYTSIHGREAAENVLEAADKIVVDNWDEMVNRGNNTISIMLNQGRIKKDDLHAELADIVYGEKESRQSEKEKIFFNSVGMGIEDVAVAARVLQRAKELGIGRPVNYWEATQIA